MCIYFKNQVNLTYVSREHIFPASIGGKKKLEKGIVSDQANEYFKPLEDFLLHKSLLAIPKMLFGPGHRGTNREGEVVVNVIRDDNNRWGLGYIFLGTSHSIPHFRFEESSENAAFLCPNRDGTDANAEIEFLVEKLRVLPEKFVYFREPELRKTLLVGFYNKKYYIASSLERVNTDAIRKLICIDISRTLSGIQVIEDTPKHDIRLMESADSTRVYGKIAFNVLAYLKGVYDKLKLTPNYK